MVQSLKIIKKFIKIWERKTRVVERILFQTVAIRHCYNYWTLLRPLVFFNHRRFRATIVAFGLSTDFSYTVNDYFVISICTSCAFVSPAFIPSKRLDQLLSSHAHVPSSPDRLCRQFHRYRQFMSSIIIVVVITIIVYSRHSYQRHRELSSSLFFILITVSLSSSSPTFTVISLSAISILPSSQSPTRCKRHFLPSSHFFSSLSSFSSPLPAPSTSSFLRLSHRQWWNNLQ